MSSQDTTARPASPSQAGSGLSQAPRSMDALRGVVRSLMHEMECLLYEYLSHNWDRVEEVLEANKHLLRDDGLACALPRNGTTLPIVSVPPCCSFMFGAGSVVVCPGVVCLLGAACVKVWQSVDAARVLARDMQKSGWGLRRVGRWCVQVTAAHACITSDSLLSLN